MLGINQATIVSKERVAKDAWELSLKVSQAMTFQAGQYLKLTVPKLIIPDPKGPHRDFSIASAPTQKNLLNIVFRNSPSGYKQTLLRFPVGSRVGVSGPFGVFTLPEPVDKPLVFIAGGVGITPFMSMLNYIVDSKHKPEINLIYVNSSEDKTVYQTQLLQLANTHDWFNLQLCYRNLSKRDLKHLLIRQHLWFVAGPPQMVTDLCDRVFRWGVAVSDMRVEEFTGLHESLYPTAKKTSQVDTIDTLMSDSASRPSADIEALMQALSTTALVSETNSAGTITYANNKFVKISQYSRQELIGQNHRILKSGYHSARFYRDLWSTITQGKVWRGIIKNKAKDGTFYWVDTAIAPIVNNQGIPKKYISVRFPITERQQAEEELKKRAKQQNVLTNLSQEALANLDIPSLMLTAIKSIARTLRVELAVIEKFTPGTSNTNFVAGVGWHKTKNVKSVVNGTGNSLGKCTLKYKSPVVIEELATESRFKSQKLLRHHAVSGVSVIIPGSDQPYGILAVFTRKIRQFSLQDVSFIQAVANLLANALRNQLDKKKDEFLGIASHELKTPLTSIKTFNQLLQKHAQQNLDDRSLLLASKIDRQLNRASDLINDLLDISRINIGKLNYRDDIFTLSRLVLEIAQEAQLMTSHHQIKVASSVTHQVKADRYRIGQVLINFLTNAIKYSPHSSQIIIKTTTNNSHFVVSVKDFGVGISKKELPYVFDRFYQGSEKKRLLFPSGLGLGLYLSSQIVKQYHGDIWVKSIAGRGSTFFFSLPVYKKKAAL